MYNINKLSSILESYLFSQSSMMSVNEIKNDFKNANIDLNTSDIKKLFEILKVKYSDESSGFEILEKNNQYYQLVTKKENYEILSSMLSPIKKKSLTQSSLETLTIIAYNEPATKNLVEKIKGVKSDATINTLLEYELIEKCGQSDGIGRPYLYKTTNKFLKYLNISSIEELPSYKLVQETKKKKEVEEEI